MNSTSLLSHNVQLYKKMKELAIKQMELVVEEKIDDFFLLFPKRQRLQTDIEKSELKYRKLAEENNVDSSPEEINSISLKISKIIQSIQEIDKRTEYLVQKKRNDLAFKIKEIHRGQKALRGYNDPSNSKGGRLIKTQG